LFNKFKGFTVIQWKRYSLGLETREVIYQAADLLLTKAAGLPRLGLEPFNAVVPALPVATPEKLLHYSLVVIKPRCASHFSRVSLRK
jgi:hypothetical protein